MTRETNQAGRGSCHRFPGSAITHLCIYIYIRAVYTQIRGACRDGETIRGNGGVNHTYWTILETILSDKVHMHTACLPRSESIATSHQVYLLMYVHAGVHGARRCSIQRFCHGSFLLVGWEENSARANTVEIASGAEWSTFLPEIN